MGVAKIAIGISFPRSITQFFCNFQATFKVVYGCFKVSQTAIGDAKTAIHFSFHRFITQFFRNFQDKFKVVYGYFNLSQTVMGVAKVAISLIFPPSLSCVCHLTLGTSFLQRNYVKICLYEKKKPSSSYIACETEASMPGSMNILMVRQEIGNHASLADPRSCEEQRVDKRN